MIGFNVLTYSILMYGSSFGYNGCHQQICLTDGTSKNVAFVRFVDEKTPYPQDTEVEMVDGTRVITMHVPDVYYDNVIDLLRNENPVSISYKVGKGFLASGNEKVGEDDNDIITAK